MTSLRLRDNRFDKNSLRFTKQSDGTYASPKENTEGLGHQYVRGAERELLEQFGGKTLDELVDEAGDAIVVLDGSHTDDSNRKSQPFFTFKSKKKGDQEDDSFSLGTGNLMGVLRFRGKGASVQVEILSRFDKWNNNFFLNYLLSKVCNFAIGAEAVSAERSSLIPILLDIVFVRRLGEAAKAGLLRHYREFRNNDWNFKGSLDLARHIRENIPLMHGIAYRKREIDLDVPVNRMILMAALTVNRRHPGFFEGNRDAADALCQLRMGVTEERDLRTVLSHRSCREPVSHPFFREVWEPLRQIARMILEDEQWTLFPETATENEVSGIVFDGSWLWEEYVAKVLEPSGFHHCANPDGSIEKVLRVFKGGRERFAPDFICGLDKKTQRADVVLDAKYKRSNPNGGGDDVHQVLCYLLLTGAKFGGLVFPPVDTNCEDKDSITASENGGEGQESILAAENRGKNKQTHKAGWSIQRNIYSPYSSEESSICWSCFSWESWEDWKRKRNLGNDWDSFEKYMKCQEDDLRKLPATT